MALITLSLFKAIVKRYHNLLYLSYLIKSLCVGILISTKSFVWQCIKASKWTTNRVRLKPEKFLEIEIPLPLLEEQKHIVTRIESLLAMIEEARRLRAEAVEEAESLAGTAVLRFFRARQGEWMVRRKNWRLCS